MEFSITYIKSLTVAGAKYDVGVDFLSGKYGSEDGSFSKHVDGIKTLPRALPSALFLSCAAGQTML